MQNLGQWINQLNPLQFAALKAAKASNVDVFAPKDGEPTWLDQ
jgi:hypothetical protein